MCVSLLGKEKERKKGRKKEREKGRQKERIVVVYNLETRFTALA